jgi:hypothetical protein
MQELTLVFLVIAIVLIIFLFKKRKELHLGKPQLFLYSLIGLVICIRSLYAFTDITSSGVDFLTGVLIIVSAILSLLVGVFCFIWALMIYPTVKAKLPSIVNHKLLNNYTTPVILIIIMVISNSTQSLADNKQSKTLGFSTENDFKDAKRNNIYSPEEYSSYLADKKAIEAKKEEDKIEKERVESNKKAQKDAECNADAYCYSMKNKGGDYICKKAVEKSAKYDFQWTDGVTEPKFSSYNWYDKGGKLVTIYGHRAKAQNGFGAYKNVTYSCTFNADTGDVINVSIQ